MANSGKITPVLFASGLAACSPPKPLSPEQVDTIISAHPISPIVGGERPTLTGLEAFYLGQSKEDAVTELKKHCPRPAELRNEWGERHTTFLACPAKESKFVHSIRIGFHPDLNDTVFTVELKRDNVPMDAMRAHFYREVETPTTDLARRGTVEIRSPKYNLFADWTSGLDGPTHAVFGLNPERITP